MKVKENMQQYIKGATNMKKFDSKKEIMSYLSLNHDCTILSKIKRNDIWIIKTLRYDIVSREFIYTNFQVYPYAGKLIIMPIKSFMSPKIIRRSIL